MQEIEVKILNIGRISVINKLVSLGAEKIFDGNVEAMFFDFSDKSIRENKKTVRLRRVGDKVFLTTKDPVAHESVKIKTEHEVEVDDFETTKNILESIGLLPWMEIKKHRTSYFLDNVHFELDKHHDQYEFVPEFLEIEAPDVETLYRYVELLGFQKEDCRPWTILDVVANYTNRN